MDVDGDALTVTAVSGATNGIVGLNTGQITFTPNANFFGTAGFDYTVSDGNGGSDTGHVTITVNAVNDAPVAVDDSRSTNEDEALVIAASSLTANDTDVDGDALTVTAVSGATNGTVSLNSGQITFSPSPSFDGAAGFDYTVSDGNGGTDTGHVAVTVVAAAPPPDEPEPTPLVDVQARPISGTILVRLPGTNTFVLLAPGAELPLGTEVDARNGVVEITSAQPDGKLERGQFTGGFFVIGQTAATPFASPKAQVLYTELRLTRGGNFAACPRPKAAKKARPKPRSVSAGQAQKPRRRLWGSASGHFRTRGRYSSATVRGTRWLTEDRCDGTLTRVTAGSVTVHDFVRRKTIVVRRGQSYLAKPKPPKAPVKKKAKKRK